MKYICLGYLEPGKFENMSESERNTVLDECFSYNDELRKNGHLVAEVPESWPGNAIHARKDRATLRGSPQLFQSNFGPIKGRDKWRAS